MKLGIFGVPIPDENICSLMIAEEEREDRDCTPSNFLPDDWKGQYVTDFMPFFNPDAFNATHLACVQSSFMRSSPHAHKCYFDGSLIENNFFLFPYDATTQSFKWIEARETAVMLLNFFIQRQERWRQEYAKSIVREGSFGCASQTRH